MDLGIRGKKALVFGASKGLGRAVSESLIAEGAEVAVCARELQRLKKVAGEIGAAAAISGDLGKAGEASRVCEMAAKELGGLDILVTNTGGPAAGDFLEVTREQWEKDFQGLWLSVVESLQFVLPKMKSEGFGRIIMLTSIAATEPLARLTTSNGLRAGLDGLCKSISNEYAQYGITINIVRPGFIDTDRMRELKVTNESVAKIAAAKRIGRPEEIGDVVAFLASQKASYITGQSLNVDGGATKSHS
jgi:3-oxoacyl-[acyl-carrier protein] reductase